MALVCKCVGHALGLFVVAGLGAQTGQPPALPGEMLPPSLGSETPKTDFLVAGLRLSGDFDDNALNNNRDKQSALATMIESHLGWALLRPHYNWLLDYHFGFSTSYPLSIYDSQSHLLDTGLDLNLTNRLKVRLRNRFLESKDPFDRLRESESMVGSGIPDRPNDSILATAVRRSSEQAGLDLTYAVGPHTIAAASGSFFRVTYGTPDVAQVAQTFENSSSIAGHAIYLHHLSPGYWAGLEYNVQELTSQRGQSRALVNSIFYTQTISLTPNMALALFAGPEHMATEAGINMPSGVPAAARASRWQWAGGATYTWTQSHRAFVAGGFRKISDGGGVLGTVRVSGATAQLRYQLTRQWTASVAAAYERNQPLLASLAPISYVSATGGLTRSLSRNLSFEVRYWKSYLPQNAALAALADHNRVSVSLAYDFRSPLGR